MERELRNRGLCIIKRVQLDTYWVQYAGVDSVEYMKAVRQRKA